MTKELDVIPNVLQSQADDTAGLLPHVAIVILNYNGIKFLQQFLPSVVATLYPNKKIYIADNASTDNSAVFVKEQFSVCTFIALEKNYGFAGGYNKALESIQADYYVLLNSDVEVTPNWINPIIDLMERDKQIAACQPKILSYNQKDQFEYAGAGGGFIDVLGYPFARGRIFDSCEKDHGQYNDILPVFWASGAAMFVRSKAFHACNGFDATFFAHMEEIDLCWRFQLTGYRVYYCGNSTVYHVGGGTLQKNHPKKTYLNFRNSLIMLYKNLLPAEKKKKLLLRIMLDLVYFVKNVFSGDIKNSKAIIKAHKDARQWKKQYSFREKRYIRKPLTSLIGVVNKYIVKEHFLFKKNSFSEIVKD